MPSPREEERASRWGGGEILRGHSHLREGSGAPGEAPVPPPEAASSAAAGRPRRGEEEVDRGAKCGRGRQSDGGWGGQRRSPIGAPIQQSAQSEGTGEREIFGGRA